MSCNCSTLVRIHHVRNCCGWLSLYKFSSRSLWLFKLRLKLFINNLVLLVFITEFLNNTLHVRAFFLTLAAPKTRSISILVKSELGSFHQTFNLLQLLLRHLLHIDTKFSDFYDMVPFKLIAIIRIISRLRHLLRLYDVIWLLWIMISDTLWQLFNHIFC